MKELKSVVFKVRNRSLKQDLKIQSNKMCQLRSFNLQRSSHSNLTKIKRLQITANINQGRKIRQRNRLKRRENRTDTMREKLPGNNERNMSSNSNETEISGTFNSSDIPKCDKSLDLPDINSVNKEDQEKTEFPVEKSYNHIEFISSDPKENEDNFHPEWQKFAILSSDDDRYNAVRERWRSFVPPDPNRNLTYRHSGRFSGGCTQPNVAPTTDNKVEICTIVFDSKIKELQQELNTFRNEILIKKAVEYLHPAKRRSSNIRQDIEINTIENDLRELEEAREEVLNFYTFYSGTRSSAPSVGNEVLLTEQQAQELIEIEQMLNQYSKFYQNTQAS